MNASLKKYRDRIRIALILYTFCEPTEDNTGNDSGFFRTEMKIQALDFLLRYPDFLCMELLDLMDSDNSINKNEIQTIIEGVYQNLEPSLRVEEMEKFFYGAYEEIDDVIAFLVSVNIIRYESRKATDGKTYDKIYFLTKFGSDRIKNILAKMDSVKWYTQRCELLKKYFGKFNGKQLKERQYRYKEYSDVSYHGHIQNINEKVKLAFRERFQKELI